MTAVSEIKRVIYLRGLLDGRRWYRALEALEFTIDAHDGQVRNDGKTPFVLHPIDVTLYLSTLSDSMVDPEGTLITSLIHDTIEDVEAITADEIEARFGPDVARSTSLLTAPEGETPEEKAERFQRIAGDLRAGPVKLADRDHNLSTMLGVFNRRRVEKYVNETREYFFPLARLARRRVPSQAALYLNLKTALERQLAPIQMLLDTPDALR